MPARKPAGLSVRHDTVEDREERAASEAAVTPKKRLPENAPRELDGMIIAAREWRRLMRLYNSLDADIVSRLDLGMMVDYCTLVEQLDQLDKMRTAMLANWEDLQTVINEMREEGVSDVKVFADAVDKAGWAFEKVVKVDQRVDRKRALVLQLRQSLYLTPRSRAGVAPQEKPKEEQKSDLDALLDS